MQDGLNTNNAGAAARELTFGEKAVGVNFNPGGHPLVNAFKTKYASLIDDLNTAREATTNPEAKRQLSIAIQKHKRPKCGQ